LWADAYRRINVAPHEPIVTIMPNTPDAIYAWLGCAWLRAWEVPINTDYRGEWLTYAISNAQARVVLTARRFAQWLALVADSLEHVRMVVIYDSEPGDDESAWRTSSMSSGERSSSPGQSPPTIWPNHRSGTS
jgi:crotonobetaine/carnitine-CoA ligase